MALLKFLFIPALAMAVVVGGLVTLFGVGALFDALEHPDELRARVEGAFRRPAKASKIASADHYYRPYWTRP
jgi:hypothetical protein